MARSFSDPGPGRLLSDESAPRHKHCSLADSIPKIGGSNVGISQSPGQGPLAGHLSCPVKTRSVSIHRDGGKAEGDDRLSDDDFFESNSFHEALSQQATRKELRHETLFKQFGKCQPLSYRHIFR